MYEQIAANKYKTGFLMFAFFIFIIIIGWVFAQISEFGYFALFIAVIIAIIGSFGSYYYSDKIVLRMSKARPVSRDELPYLYHINEGLAIAAGIPTPKAFIIDDTAPNAFATGRDPEHAVIAVTSGLLDKLNRQELEGVVAHEMSHIKNFDIRLQTVTVVMVGIIALLSDWMLRTFFWGGRRRRDSSSGNIGVILIVVGLVLAILSPIIAQLIRLAISRKREYLADASGAMLTRFPEGLANALLKISEDKEPLEVANKATSPLYIATPFNLRKRRGSYLWETHPPIKERVAKLREMSFQPEVPS